uniref:oxaloacetate tautomerase n=1 Tax=Steinernema glaseri TaxID=37863 RepID=A0A1I7YVR8_9BILA
MKVWAESLEFPDDVAVSAFLHNIEHPHTLSIWSAVNGQEVQRGLLADTLRSIPDVVERASQLTTLHKGDLVLCGTPAGAQYVKAGDVVEIGIDDHVRCQFNVEKYTDVSAPTGPSHF